MADSKISALPASTVPLAGTEVLAIVQSSTTKQVSVANLTAGRAISALSIATTTGATFATTSGSVGVGTLSPAVTLHASASVANTSGAGTEILRVANTRVNTNASGAGVRFVTNEIGGTDQYTRAQITGEYDDSTDVNGRLLFATTNTSGTLVERMRISSTGIVTMPAYGAGAATFSAAGVISSVSDETWKTKDGVPVNTDAMLQKLEPGYWFYNEEKAPIFGEDRQLGFYAQNVNEAIGPEAAPTPEEGKPWGYYDRSILAVTVMSLKNALSTIEELKQRITALENK